MVFNGKLHNTIKTELMKDVITKEVTFNQAIDKVWSAITKAEEISILFILTNFKAKKGCIVISGEAKNASPYLLVYTQQVSEMKTKPTVTWVLKTTPEGTK